MDLAAECTDTLCNVESEWAEFWDVDDWETGCVSNMASWYDAELMYDEGFVDDTGTLMDEAVWTCPTCLEQDENENAVY